MIVDFILYENPVGLVVLNTHDFRIRSTFLTRSGSKMRKCLSLFMQLLLSGQQETKYCESISNFLSFWISLDFTVLSYAPYEVLLLVVKWGWEL